MCWRCSLQQPHSLSLQEIANRLDRSPNELFRMLDVLVRRGFLAGCQTRPMR